MVPTSTVEIEMPVKLALMLKVRNFLADLNITEILA
tara:strand:- start:4893 stop:5000 length:108 start_codon:yes stop_codon:yes gene_type:complete